MYLKGLLILIVLPLQMMAQEKFVFEGKIEYERKINVHRQLDDMEDESWMKTILPTVPNFHNSNFVLQFNKSETIYRPSGEMPTINMPWLIGPAKENIILTQLSNETRTSYKTVFEKKFQVVDSIKQGEWRITDEKRTIAGMECRKAVTIICDSVYVVAFYADEIPVSGGPESFGGLPGMILGLAIPRLHTTWFASRIVLAEPSAKDFAVNQRGEKTNNEKLKVVLKSSMKDWAKMGQRNMWWILL